MNMQLTITKIGIYQVRCICYLSVFSIDSSEKMWLEKKLRNLVVYMKITMMIRNLHNCRNFVCWVFGNDFQNL